MMDEAIISAFSDGVRDVKMKEELAIHEELCTSLELFNLRPSAQELRRDNSTSSSTLLSTQKKRRPRPRT